MQTNEMFIQLRQSVITAQSEYEKSRAQLNVAKIDEETCLTSLHNAVINLENFLARYINVEQNNQSDSEIPVEK